VASKREAERLRSTFLRTEEPRLLRSLKVENPTPLRPGVGATAATLAQAFNSSEGRRFLRLQRELTQRTAKSDREWRSVIERLRVSCARRS